MGRSSCFYGRQRLPAVPCLHRADRRAGHHCVDQDHIVGTLPGLDKIRGVANARVRFYAELPQSLCDQDSSPVVASLPIPTANDKHASTLTSSRSTTTFRKWVAQEMHGS